MRGNRFSLRRSATLGAVAVLSLAGLAPAALGSTASAEESGTKGDVSSAVTAPTSFGQEASKISDGPQAASGRSNAPDKKVAAYWTEERMAAAKPYEGPQPDADGPPKPASGSTSSTDPFGKIDPVGPKDASSGASTMPDGILFFDSPDGPSSCSASVVNAPSKRVLVTAGHCVYGASADGQGFWMTNMVFVPGYDGTAEDAAPAGVWTARSLRTFDAWIENTTDYTNDVGFVTLNDGGDATQPVADAVGAHGLAWGGSHDFQATIHGYPSNQSAPGGNPVMRECKDGVIEESSMGMVDGCDFGFGASGGPWLHSYDASASLGRVRSVTSLWHPVSKHNWGPYFSRYVKDMMDATAAD